MYFKPQVKKQKQSRSRLILHSECPSKQPKLKFKDIHRCTHKEKITKPDAMQLTIFLKKLKQVITQQSLSHLQAHRCMHAHTKPHTHAHMRIHTHTILAPKSAACPLPLCWIYCDSHYANEIPTVTLSFCICFLCFLLKPLPKRQIWAKCISSAFSLLLFRTAGFPCGSPEERPSGPSEEGGEG